MATKIILQRETIEYLPHTVVVKDAVTGEVIEDAEYELCVVPYGERPSEWLAPPYLISGYDPGVYAAYSRVPDSPESVVDLIGLFTVD